MSTQPLEATVSVCREVLSNVTADQLQNATPCASWDVAGLVNHIVGGQAFFSAGIRGEAPSADETDWSAGDFVAAFDQNSSTMLEGFQAEGALERTVVLPFGEFPGSGFMGLAMTDVFQHSWDLAKATGQSTDLAPELAAQLLAASKQSIQDGFRGPEGAPFAAEQQCADGACAADQLAAFLGREVS